MKEKLKNYPYIIFMTFLILLLIFVSYFMLSVHIPSYNHQVKLDEIRNQICEENNLQYQDYFYQYNSKDVYYILKVKVNDVDSYVAYDKDLKLVNYYQGEIVDFKEVKNEIKKNYKVDVSTFEIGYENNRFVYYCKYQTDNLLQYFYYALDSGDFVKTYQL